MAAHVLDQEIGLRRGIVATVDEDDRNDIHAGNVNAERISFRPCVAVAGSQTPTKAIPAYMRACPNFSVQPPIAPIAHTSRQMLALDRRCLSRVLAAPGGDV
jgi:hypothetical protein